MSQVNQMGHCSSHTQKPAKIEKVGRHLLHWAVDSKYQSQCLCLEGMRRSFTNYTYREIDTRHSTYCSAILFRLILSPVPQHACSKLKFIKISINYRKKDHLNEIQPKFIDEQKSLLLSFASSLHLCVSNMYCEFFLCASLLCFGNSCSTFRTH